MKKTILPFIVTVFLLSCASHDKHNKQYYAKISPTDLKKDVQYVKKQMIKMHPDLYWYISKEALDKKFDSLNTTLTNALTPNEFYLKISPIVASVRQGHMSMSMLTLTSPDSLKKKYKESVNPFNNFEYEYLNDKLYIVKNKSKTDNLIQIGTEVIDIDGIKPADLYIKYRNTLTSDGYNSTGIPKFFARKINTYYISELGFVDSIAMKLSCADSVFNYKVLRTFKKEDKKKSKNDTLVPLVSKSKESLAKKEMTKEELKIKQKIEDRQRKTLEKRKAWYGYDEKDQTYSKEVIYPVVQDSTIAILKIRGFSEGKLKVYDTIFTEFNKNKVKNLILDLRGNPGGRLSDIFRLSQFLNDTPYVLTYPATITNRGTYFNMFKEKNFTGKILMAPFITIYSTIRGLSAVRNDKGELQVPIQSSKKKTPNVLNYKNRLYVITDGMTFSAAAIISSHLKGRKRATFVGDETGGAFNGTVAGVMPVIKLPKTKLKLRIGLMTIKPTEQTLVEGYGVLPDVVIKPSIEELVNKKDPELQWILKDIGVNKN